MNLNELNLSNYDKLYMMNNERNFPLNMKTDIRSNSCRWEDEIRELDPNLINQVQDENAKIHMFFNYFKPTEEDEFKDVIDRTLSTLIDKPSFDIKDVKYLFISLKQIFDLIDDRFVLKYKITSNQFVTQLISYILYKLKAFNINQLIEKREYPLLLNKYDILVDLFNSLLLSNSVYLDCIVVKLITKVLLVEDNFTDKAMINSLLSMISLLHNYDSAIVNNAWDDLQNSSLLDYISNHNVNISDTAFKFISLNCRTMPNILVCSDGFDIDNTRENGIYKFIRNTNLNSLKEYVGNYADLTFSIPENVSGYLRFKNEFPVGKTLIKEKDSEDLVNTICEINNIIYLLFFTPSISDKCFGIEIDNDKDELSLLTIEIPTNKRYTFI